MTGKKIDIVWAFIVGGCLSVITEGLWWLLLAIGLPADSWAITGMLMILAFIGMVTTYFGWLQKLIGKAGFGVFLPFCSLPSSIVLDYTASRSAGNKIGKSAWAGLKGPAFVFGTGISCSIVLALIVYGVNGKKFMISQLMASSQIESTPMSAGLFLRAFLVGGLICAIWQIFFRINKQSVVLNMAMAIYVGAVLTSLSAMERIIAFGGRGMVLQIHDTGEAVYRWFSAIILFGNFSGVLRFILLLAFVFIGGLIFGELFYRKTGKGHQKEV